MLNATLECQPGRDYDERAFLYFLSLEQARADRSNHPLRLLLAMMEPVAGEPVPMEPRAATRLFAGLRQSLRDTDVVGWYRQDRVAGAVLVERPDADGVQVSDLIRQRVDEGLRQRLPVKIARSLHVQVVQLQPPFGS